MRFFAAVLPPRVAIEELAAEVAALRRLSGADRLRWTGRPGWHFTLAFYGEVADELVPELRLRLERAAHRHHPYEMWIKGGGHFGDRALWAGVAGDREAMRHLAGSAEAAARKAGLVSAGHAHRPYHPHLTIARGRDRGARAHLAPFAAVLDAFESSGWTVGELALVRSNLPVSGAPGEQPRYETEAAWPLGR
ncbi:RNA 2',3'-cyclic phosphodiesterase [Streptomyces halobius]|uniref:RNA 2',3'-cyclic phosphodiesterase n=1 Tax=Streptomyces halobius TaxID=2879846 RepID=A0ABY4M9X3_9ACTN|nr:RNA 2',3'-cyclic phosphodiesterase [Streptomyces halobius]UQA93584.1 RNA 2',3'-cyclic phosphodiesterase [Streptomyces halobius]